MRGLKITVLALKMPSKYSQALSAFKFTFGGYTYANPYTHSGVVIESLSQNAHSSLDAVEFTFADRHTLARTDAHTHTRTHTPTHRAVTVKKFGLCLEI